MNSVTPTVTANEAKARLGAMLEMAQREPVTITRHGRPSAVLLSAVDYEKIKELFDHLEDQYWYSRAMEAEAEGFIGVEEGEKFLTEIRNAQD